MSLSLSSSLLVAGVVVITKLLEEIRLNYMPGLGTTDNSTYACWQCSDCWLNQSSGLTATYKLQCWFNSSRST